MSDSIKIIRKDKKVHIEIKSRVLADIIKNKPPIEVTRFLDTFYFDGSTFADVWVYGRNVSLGPLRVSKRWTRDTFKDSGTAGVLGIQDEEMANKIVDAIKLAIRSAHILNKTPKVNINGTCHTLS